MPWFPARRTVLELCINWPSKISVRSSRGVYLAAHDGTHEWASRTPARGAISPERRQKTEFGGNIETLWPTQPFTPILPPVNLVATDDEGRHTVRNQRTGPFTLPVQHKSSTSVQPKGFDTAERREPGVRICRIVDGRLQSLSEIPSRSDFAEASNLFR